MSSPVSWFVRDQLFFSELRERLTQSIGVPLQQLGELELSGLWRIWIEGVAGEPWPGPDEVDRLRVEKHIRVERAGRDKYFVTVEAHVEGATATDAVRVVYWELRAGHVISDQRNTLLNARAIDERDRPQSVSMEAVVQKSRP